MQRGNRIGFHVLFSRPTSAGAGRGTLPSQSWRAATIPASGMPAWPWGKSLTRCPSCLPSGWDTSPSTIFASMPPTWRARASSPRSSRRACTRKRSCRGCPRASSKSTSKPNGKPGHFRVIDKVRQRVAFQWHDLLSLQGNRPRLLAGRVQERAAPLSAARKDRSAEDVPPGAGAGRLLRHRADAGDAAGTGVACLSG